MKKKQWTNLALMYFFGICFVIVGIASHMKVVMPFVALAIIVLAGIPVAHFYRKFGIID